MNKNRIFAMYWSPFLGKVATIKSVINSILSINKKKNFEVQLLDCYGEWNDYKPLLKKNNISIFRLQKKIDFKTDNYGFLRSRLIYFLTFLFTYLNLKNHLKKNKPKYLIIHLLTFIPLVLFLFNKFDTKLILRISGRPKLNLFRYYLWKFSSKKIYLIFCPTIETKKEINRLKIFSPQSIKYLPDPVLNVKEIQKLKKKKTNKLFFKNSHFLVVGRFTKQKNHDLILRTIEKYKLKDNFLFIGEGELKKNIQKKINILNLQNQVKILNYQPNIFDYIHQCKAVIVPSLWEDPGFVMIESAFLKKIVLSSDCKSGPKEFIGKENAGFLFKSNDPKSLKDAILRYKISKKNLIKKKIINAKNNSKIYKIEFHRKLLKNYLL